MSKTWWTYRFYSETDELLREVDKDAALDSELDQILSLGPKYNRCKTRGAINEIGKPGNRPAYLIDPKTLRQLREAMSWSKRQLAERSDLSGATIAKLEKAEKSINARTVTKLAEALEIAPEDLLFRQTERSK